ncbi:unnamed protein product [Lepidochelys kempii]
MQQTNTELHHHACPGSRTYSLLASPQEKLVTSSSLRRMSSVYALAFLTWLCWVTNSTCNSSCYCFAIVTEKKS